MKYGLIQDLFEGPLDIVGDVHGEIGPLRSLMRHLGYDDQSGIHPDGRRLVFVGDLTDRGPDSPAVVNLVQRLVESGRAQCVMGNHDLNILWNCRKHDNKHWFFGESVTEDDVVGPQEFADESLQEQIRAFFRTLPLALARDDLRIVHACWNDEAVDIARGSDSAVALYEEHHDLIERRCADLDCDEIDKGLEHQNRNPVKLLTSGPETRVEEPFEAGGKLRFEKRVEWWHDYRGPCCVFGHYSITTNMGLSGKAAYCVDHAVGYRWTERLAGKSRRFEHRLAALRWPERVVMFDEGHRRRI